MNSDSKDLQIESAESQALDWKIKLNEKPNNFFIKRAHAIWLQSNPLHLESWNKIEKLWLLTGQIKPETSKHWPKTDTNIHKKTNNRFKRFSTAAILVLSISIGWHVKTGEEHPQQQRLTDGSTIWSAPGTKIEVNFNNTQRKVTLYLGKAYFKVSPENDRPFIVQKGNTKIKVTGTAFAVENTGQQLTIAVESGSVLVNHEQHQFTLTAGQQANIQTKSSSPPSIHPVQGKIAHWRKLELEVKNQSIKTLVKDVERYTSWPIIILDPTLSTKTVSGLYDMSDPEQALSEMLYPHGADFKKIWPGILLIDKKD